MADLRYVLRDVRAAINPPDRNGISLHIWNERLKEATTKIDAALAEPPDHAALRDAFRAGYAAHPADDTSRPETRNGAWSFDLAASSAGDREPEAWRAWEAIAALKGSR